MKMFKTFIERPPSYIKPEVFTGSKGKDIITWIDRFEIIAINNAWCEAKQFRTMPLYLAKSALIFCSNLSEPTKNNRELVKDALRRQYRSEDRKWCLRSDLYALSQTDTLTQYIDQL